MAGRLHATLVPFQVCTPHPYGGSFVVHSEHATIEEVERKVILLGLVDLGS